MRILTLTVLALTAAATVSAQPAPGRTLAPSAAESLPVRRVILYKTGVGYFEHRGRIVDNQAVSIRFTTGQLNDVLKSLTTLDLGNGRITGIGYNSMEPLDRRINALRLPVGRNATVIDLLAALRGARVELSSGGGGNASGRLLSIERRRRQGDAPATTDVDVVSIVTNGGELRTYDVDASLRVRVEERELRDEIEQYLDLVAAVREQDVRRMIIRTAGSGEREIFVSYVSEVPVWKTTYRLVLSERGAPLLQGWAIVDNTIGEDWTGVQLSLVAGAPQTFVQPISQPYYTRRPVVPLPQTAVLTPQTHAPTLESGSGTLAGVVRDSTGAVLPGVRVLLRDGARQATAMADARGEYRITVPAGLYDVEFQLSGFAPVVLTGVNIGGGFTRQQDAILPAAAVQETITVTGATPAGARAPGQGVSRGSGSGVAGGIGPPPPPAAPVSDFARAIQPAAAAGDVGDLFEYRITDPVSIPKNQSALVPVLSAEIMAEKVSLWTRASGSGRPLRAVWVTNTSALTLDGGTFSVMEGEAFAGEGLMDSLEPGERRLLSYAADLAVLVSAEPPTSTNRIVRLRARDGVIVQDTEERTTATYRIRNEDAVGRTVVVEHPSRSGWQLAGGLEPAERSPAAYRFRVAVDPRSEATLGVPESRTIASRISIGEVDEARLELWMRSGFAAADLERALRPVIEQQQALAAIEQQIARREAERQAISADQQRLRENLKALGSSVEERPLRERYIRELTQQEDRLDTVERELTDATDAHDRARRELSRLIGEVTFEIGAPKS